MQYNTTKECSGYPDYSFAYFRGKWIKWLKSLSIPTIMKMSKRFNLWFTGVFIVIYNEFFL